MRTLNILMILLSIAFSLIGFVLVVGYLDYYLNTDGVMIFDSTISKLEFSHVLNKLLLIEVLIFFVHLLIDLFNQERR